MIDHELERLHRYLDDEMSAEERLEFEALLESNETLRKEVDLYASLGHVLREHVEHVVEATEFDGFFDGIEAQISSTESRPSIFEKIRTFIFSPAGGAALVVAAVCLLYFGQQEPPSIETAQPDAPVIVEQKSNTGNHLIEVSKPVDDKEPTVIWLLEGEKDGGVSADGTTEEPF